jgi:hypothetical protein
MAQVMEPNHRQTETLSEAAEPSVDRGQQRATILPREVATRRVVIDVQEEAISP